MSKIVLRHLSGSRMGQVDEFPVDLKDGSGQFQPLTIGRDPSAQVTFDAVQDDLVSRRHAQIAPHPSEPGAFNLVDLGSRNGAFVNRQRVFGTTRLTHGDIVQLGPGGSEFRFELDPPPAGTAQARETRLASQSTMPGTQAPPTREGSTTPIRPEAAAGGGSHRPVGRSTVERLIGQVEAKSKGDSRRAIFVGVATFAALLAVAAFVFVANQRQQEQTAALGEQLTRQTEELTGRLEKEQEENAKKHRAELASLRTQLPSGSGAQPSSAAVVSVRTSEPMDAPAISQTYSGSVVFLDVSWHLVDKASGRRVRHALMPTKAVRDRITARLSECEDYLSEGCDLSSEQVADLKKQQASLPKELPAYIKLGKDVYPILVYDDYKGSSTPIRGQHTGSGFVISSDGYILTNRHVAAAWMHDYPLPEVGIVYPGGDENAYIASVNMSGWIPAGKNFVLDQAGVDVAKLVTNARDKELTGAYTAFKVGFPNSSSSVDAQFKQFSHRQDVALVKVDVPWLLNPVELHPDPRSTHQGSDIVIMGYPGSAPKQGERVVDGTVSGGASFLNVPSPSLSKGVIGRILDPNNGVNAMGDVFELSSGPGVEPGSSGGPVFDSAGRVIGLLTYGARNRLTYAVPVDYAFEMIRPQSR